MKMISLPHAVVRALMVVVLGVGAFSFVGAATAASGHIYLITSNPDLEAGTTNFGGFLRSLGYTVEVEPPGGGPYRALDTATNQAELIAQLITNDLVIIHRNFGSGTLASSPAEVAIWNRLDVPILLCNAPIARNDRWRWINASSGSAMASRSLNLLVPDHLIVGGLAADLFVADRIYGGTINGTDGGTNMVAIANASVPPFDPMCLAVWDENEGETRAFYQDGGETYTRRRVFFEMHEYRNGGDWNEVTPNGRQMWANAVEYAMTGIVTPPPPEILDLNPAPGSSFNSAVTEFSFRATNAQPIEPSGIRVVVNDVDVSASLQISGLSNDRIVVYPGLVPGQVYNVEIEVTNTNGSSLKPVQFDTFVENDVAVWEPTGEGVYNSFFAPGPYQLYLRAASETAQFVTLTQTNSLELPPAGRLVGGFLLPGGTTNALLFPLRDVVNPQTVIRLPDDIVFFTAGPRTNVTLGSLYLVPAPNATNLLLPTIGWASPFSGEADVSVLAQLDLEVIDRDTVIDPATARLFVDGVDVTGMPQTTISATASGVALHYSPPNFLAPGQTHTVQAIFADTASPANVVTQEYAFSTESMPALPPALAREIGSGLERGFNIRIHTASGNPDPVFTNTAARAELQLAGALWGPSGPVTNFISGTTNASAYVESGVLNYNQVNTNSGRFPADRLFPFGELAIPELMAFEATAYLELGAGLHKFGVGSDDGFRLSAGDDPNLVLGVYEGPRGDQVPSEFTFLVYQPGLYPVRLLYYDGGGSASLEFYSLHDSELNPDTGGRVLINGTNVNGLVQVAAYREVRPRLEIDREGNEVVLTWITSGTFALEEKSDLAPGAWSPVGQPPTVVGTRSTVRLPLAATEQKYFRLVSQ